MQADLRYAREIAREPPLVTPEVRALVVTLSDRAAKSPVGATKTTDLARASELPLPTLDGAFRDPLSSAVRKVRLGPSKIVSLLAPEHELISCHLQRQ